MLFRSRFPNMKICVIIVHMDGFAEKLEALLKTDTRFCDAESGLLKNEVADKAYKGDEKLVAILLGNAEAKRKFFAEVDGHAVFKTSDFVAYISDKHFLNDSSTQFKNKIGLTVGGKFLNERKEVVLAWPFKDCVLEGGMTKEDEKRKEIFFNETLAQDEIDKLFAPKVLTNWKRYTAKGAEKTGELKRDKDGTIRENLIIKGNNLLALHSLKKQFQGKVKLIYIDPPYNTGSDNFGYNDNFNHSTWLTFMKNRLGVAKQLLSSDGVICVQADDSEQSYLKVLLDEVFDRNFLSTLYIQVRYPDKQLAKAMTFHKLIETVHIYSKSEKPKLYQKEEEYNFSKYTFEIREKKKSGKTIQLGPYKVDIFDKDSYEIIKHEKPHNKFLKEIWASGKILDSSSTGRFFRDYLDGRFAADGLGVLYKVYGIGEGTKGYRYITGPQRDGATRGKYFQEIPAGRLSGEKANDLSAIENYFDYAGYFGNCRHEGGVPFRGGKKPEILLKDILEITTKKGDLVLDYHLGSGTTCAVAHKTGRQYIGVEQLDYGNSDGVTRLKNVILGDTTGVSEQFNWKGGGDFVYCEMMKYNERFVEDIEAAVDTRKLLNIWEDIKKHAFVKYNVDMQEFDKDIVEFKKLPLAEQKKILLQTLNKNQLYVNLSEIGDADFKVGKEDKEANNEFYGK